jgi:hypothetical protein
MKPLDIHNHGRTVDYSSTYVIYQTSPRLGPGILNQLLNPVVEQGSNDRLSDFPTIPSLLRNPKTTFEATLQSSACVKNLGVIFRLFIIVWFSGLSNSNVGYDHNGFIRFSTSSEKAD